MRTIQRSTCGEPGKTMINPALQERAFDIFRMRRLRCEIFGRAMFGEPAWEVLLLLYATGSGAPQSLTQLASFIGTSRTTATRWIDYLEAQSLVTREADPTDKRTVFVELTDRGKHAMEAFLLKNEER